MIAVPANTGKRPEWECELTQVRMVVSCSALWRFTGLYWGKIIGTLAGLATLKPWFAAVGLFLGHQFDRGFAARYTRFQQDQSDAPRVSEDFVRALFEAMGHLAKVDGRVSQKEIRAARMVMHRLALSPAQVRKAIGWFDTGKQAGFPLQDSIRVARRTAVRNKSDRSLFVRLLLEVALAKDSIRQPERASIWIVCKELGIGRVEQAQLEAMIRAQKGFRQSPAGDADNARITKAYETLGISSGASNDEVKTAYRRLMNRYHPDKVSANDPDDAKVAEAGRRTREIRSAYELLKARRSIR